MPEPKDDRQRAAELAIGIIDAYVRSDADGLHTLTGRVESAGTATAELVTSELRVFTAFLTRRVQETGVVYKPADSRDAVAAAVADLLPPELEFAVVTAWEAHSVGEEEAAERMANGDPMVAVHMFAAFCSAVGKAVYRPAELISTLRLASGVPEDGHEAGGDVSEPGGDGPGEST